MPQPNIAPSSYVRSRTVVRVEFAILGPAEGTLESMLSAATSEVLRILAAGGATPSPTGLETVLTGIAPSMEGIGVDLARLPRRT